MEHKKYSPRSILKMVCGVGFTFWLMMGAPTGWIYDFGVGTGTEQGQMPNPSVSVVHTQEDVEDFFFQTTPATVSKEDFIQCPLLRLRDSEYAGDHTHLNGRTKRTVTISEYIPVAYPTGPIRNFLLEFFTSGSYNSYYLAPLSDGSYVCVYFDDYLMLKPGDDLPTGYLRYTTTEEASMLHQMAEEYEVNPVYVLDMYRHGKVNWMLDFAIRAAVGIFLFVVGSTMIGCIKKANQHRGKEDVEPQIGKK